MRSMTKTRWSEGWPEDSLRPFSGGMLCVFALGVLALGGCGDLQPVATFEPETDGAKLYGSLTLNHRAINLSTAAPYDTIRLTATPRNLRGEPLEGLPAPTFRSSDTVAVWVTPDGLVQARAATGGAQVIAEVVTGDNVRHADTAYVKVTSNPTPPKLASFSIAPESPEDSVWFMTSSTMNWAYVAYGLLQAAGISFEPILPLRALDSDGNPVLGLEVDYVSLAPANISLDRRSGTVQSVFGPPGKVTLIARTTAYGVAKADTTTVTVVAPMFHGFVLLEDEEGFRIEPTEVTLRAGGYVSWFNVSTTGTAVGITFDDPTDVEIAADLCTAFGGFMPAFCEDGDIAPFFDEIPSLSVRYRQFLEPGIYEFKTTVSGLKGRIRVIADDQPLSVNGDSKQ